MKLFLRPMNNRVKRVYDFINENNMLESANLIVGLSGGADSICLISILDSFIKDNNLDIHLLAVHVNHGIRENATRDENFVRDFCKNKTIDLVVKRIDCIGIAKELGLTVEEAGRLKRYEIFEELAKELDEKIGATTKTTTKTAAKIASKLENFNKPTRIAVAHHQNDQAETILMNMARGTNLKGLRGIKPVRDRIIRPLLCLKRSEIEEYIRENSLSYVVDETNFNNDYTRNSIRNVIIPSFEKNVNSNFVENLSNMASRMQLMEDFIENVTSDAFSKAVLVEGEVYKINLKELACLDRFIANELIYRVLSLAAAAKKDIYEINVKDVYKLVSLETGKEVSLPYGLVARKGYDYIFVEKRHAVNIEESQNINIEDNPEKLKLEIDLEALKKTDMENELLIERDFDAFYKGKIIKIRGLRLRLVDNKISIKDYNSDYAKCFDYDKIKSTIVIRYREAGDFLVVDELGHSHKLKNEFINRKIDRDFRKSCLLVCQDNECLWAFGIRRSESALVSDTTKKVLIVEFLL